MTEEDKKAIVDSFNKALEARKKYLDSLHEIDLETGGKVLVNYGFFRHLRGIKYPDIEIVESLFIHKGIRTLAEALGVQICFEDARAYFLYEGIYVYCSRNDFYE